MRDNLTRLEQNLRRARTIHEKEQARGHTNLGVRQTRRMYYAVRALQNAAGKLERETRSLRLVRGGKYPVCRQWPCRHGEVV